MSMSLAALREVFKDVPPSNLPPEFAACLFGDKEAIETNHAAYLIWEENNMPQRPPLSQADPRIATPQLATPDPTHSPILPIATPTPSQRATVLPSQASACVTRQTPPGTTDGQGTCSPPGSHAARGISRQPDLALLVCPNALVSKDRAANGNLWAPHDLFLEISTAPSLNDPLALNADPPALNAIRTRCKKTPKLTQGPKPNLPRRTTCNKSSINQNKETGLITLDAQDFVEIPLQYAEGRQLLTSIGAAAILIPADLVNSTTTKTSNIEAGLPKNTKLKRKQPISPSAQQSTSQLAYDPAPTTAVANGPLDRCLGHEVATRA